MKSTKSLQISLDFRVISAVLLIIVLAMLGIWKPWHSAPSDDRTIQVTGEASVTTEPDEFVFYPRYEFKGKGERAPLNTATQKINDVTAKLKELGVGDNQIKSDLSGYERSYYLDKDSNAVYAAGLTITIQSKELAEKVQNYLATTTPTGSVTPQSQLSDAKRKEIESQARDQATNDAQAKAEQTAGNLGARVGSLKSVTDGAGFDMGPMPMATPELARDGSAAVGTTAFPLQPGENKLHYSVVVTYYLR